MEMSETLAESTVNLKEAFKNSIVVKVAVITTMIFFMIIPKFMVAELIDERMERGEEVVTEIGDKWGKRQTLKGPVLSIPAISASGEMIMCYTYPETLEVVSNLDDNERQRGIYKAVLYTAKISLKAGFMKPEINDFDLSDDYRLNFEKAFLSFEVSDVRGIADSISIDIDENQYSAKPGIPFGHEQEGFHVPFNLINENFAVNAEIGLKGSEEFHVIPVGKSASVSMSSKWQDPSFSGEFLPNERSVSENGFSAKWNVHALQRNSVQHWQGKGEQKNPLMVGVKLLQTNSFYQKIQRTVKYAILFLSFTFAAVFISERLTKINIHPVQYILTGIASMLFYVMLLSLSEHLAFNISYVLTTSLITLLISAYAKGIFKLTKVAVTLGGVSSLLYLFLFVTLQQEDYALLMGSSGLFIVLAIVMYLTRNISHELDAEMIHS